VKSGTLHSCSRMVTHSGVSSGKGWQTWGPAPTAAPFLGLLVLDGQWLLRRCPQDKEKLIKGPVPPFALFPRTRRSLNTHRALWWMDTQPAQSLAGRRLHLRTFAPTVKGTPVQGHTAANGKSARNLNLLVLVPS
jgi:hypothetical protein